MSKERVKKLRRKAGDKLKALGTRALNFDNAYADRVSADMERYMPPLAKETSQMLGGTKLGDMETSPEARKLGGASLLSEQAAIAAVRATNLGYRYGLPAAGLTLAGKGLADMTNNFGTAADQPEQGTLPLS